MITEKLSEIFRWKTGYLLHEGFQIKCAGQSSLDTNGLPIVIDRHLICTLGNHLPGTQAHAVQNAEFTDDLWAIEPTQAAINWASPICQICQKEIAP